MIYISHYEVFDNCVGDRIDKILCLKRFRDLTNLEKFRNKTKYKWMQITGLKEIEVYFDIHEGAANDLKMYRRELKKRIN